MAKATLPTNCIECNVKLTSKNRSSSTTNVGDVHTDRNDVCIRCYDYWGWENTHSDEGHDSLAADARDMECLVCRKIAADLAEDKGWTTDTGRKNLDHSTCLHPRTPKGRAACRKARALGTPMAALTPNVMVGKGATVHGADGDLLVCTTRPFNPNNVTRTGADVTCKNCLKKA